MHDGAAVCNSLEGRGLMNPISARLALAAVCVGAVFVVAGSAVSAVPNGPSPDLVLSQIYGGGGNSGATYSHDFIELFNRGTASVSLEGKSLQYTSATGTGNFGSATNLITPLSGSIAPGQYILVQESSNAAVGSPLPTPDDLPIRIAKDEMTTNESGFRYHRRVDRDALAADPAARISQKLLDRSSGADAAAVNFIRTPPGDGSPHGMHTHAWEQIFYVLEGTMMIEVEGHGEFHHFSHYPHQRVGQAGQQVGREIVGVIGRSDGGRPHIGVGQPDGHQPACGHHIVDGGSGQPVQHLRATAALSGVEAVPPLQLER